MQENLFVDNWGLSTYSGAMKVAAVQLISDFDIQDNLELALNAISEAADNGAKLIVLPEATSQAFGTGRLDKQAQQLDGGFAHALHTHAAELGVVVVAGMFRPADTVQRGDKTINRIYNTALITGPDIHRGYDKIQTFDAFDYRESDTVKPGSELVTFTVDGLTIGVAICFDIRFPTHFQDLARAGAQAIVVPTSWANGEGKIEQWRTLASARALDSTSWIIAADQALPDKESDAPIGVGYSAIIRPDGVRVAEGGSDPEIIYADIDAETVEKTRAALPIL